MTNCDTPDQAFRPLAPEQAALFEHSPHPVLVLDSEFRIRYVNAATEAYGHVDRGSLIGRHVWSCYPALRNSMLGKAYEGVLHDGQPTSFENYDVEGQRWHAVRAYPADGGVIAVLEDVSERRRNERALIGSERALARAQSLAAIGSWSHSSTTGTQFSAEAYRILGLDPADIAVNQLAIQSRIPPAQLDELRSAITIAVAGAGAGAEVRHTIKFLRPDNSDCVLDVQIRVERIEDGQPIEFYGTIQDVTARTKASEELQRSEETLRLAQEAAGIGSFDRDLRTRQSRWSDQLLRIVGLAPENVVQPIHDNDPTMQFLHPDDRSRVRAAFKSAILSGEKATLRHRIVRRNGDIRHIQSSTMMVRDVHGAPARIVGTSLDITDQVIADERQRRLHDQIQQAQKLESLGILAGGIAHDFNNLLVGILGNASLALPEIGAAHRAYDHIVAIDRAAQRAAELTRQLLAYAGKGRFVVESVDASVLVQEMNALLNTVVARSATVQLELATGLPPISVDATQFRQVLMNLITNASDALGGQPGVITLRTRVVERTREFLDTCVQGTDAEPGRFVCIEVTDTGAGMDAATMEKIFDPFFSTKFTGRGLGLAATLGIMRSHHGTIHVSSEIGRGTAFTLCFPAGTGTPAVTPSDVSPAWRASGEVLVIDDEPTVRKVTSAMLTRRGFTVTAVESGEEALALFRESPERFALVLLDLTLPVMDGATIFRALREISSEVRVVLMSGYDESEVTQKFVGQGLAGFVQKPFRADDLYDMVARTIRPAPH